MIALKQIDIRRSIDAKPAQVYRLLDDSASWPRWTPIGSFERIDAPGEDGLGEVRLFRTGQVRVKELIVERVPDRCLSYVQVEGLAVRDCRTRIELEPTAAGCEVRWHTTFRPKFPGTGWIYSRALEKANRTFVDGLAEYSADLVATELDG